jgi:endonuclease-3
MSEAQKAQAILKLLDKAYPDAPPTYLDHRNPFEMMIATILSAHTADKAVNMITPELFSKYPDPESMMKAPLKSIANIIRPCGTYNRKAVFLRDASKALTERFSGQVPRNMGDLMTLSGISRKTANVVLSVCFGINEGIVVDTHIMRVTQRLGISTQKAAAKIEHDLMGVLTQDKWHDYARLAGAHGRRTCKAKKPTCGSCAVRDLCPSATLYL